MLCFTSRSLAFACRIFLPLYESVCCLSKATCADVLCFWNKGSLCAAEFYCKTQRLSLPWIPLLGFGTVCFGCVSNHWWYQVKYDNVMRVFGVFFVYT